MNPIFRNTLLSGTFMLLAFLLLFLLKPEDGNRSIDNINNPMTTMLFVLGMILPGFLFGTALSLAIPSATLVKKIIFVALSGFLYMGLMIGSFGKGSGANILVVIASGIGGFLIMLLVHFLLHPLPLIQSLIAGTVIGVIAAIPFFLMFQAPEDAKSIGKIAGILGLSIYLIWHAGMGFYLSKVIKEVI